MCVCIAIIILFLLPSLAVIGHHPLGLQLWSLSLASSQDAFAVLQYLAIPHPSSTVLLDIKHPGSQRRRLPGHFSCTTSLSYALIVSSTASCLNGPITLFQFTWKLTSCYQLCSRLYLDRVGVQINICRIALLKYNLPGAGPVASFFLSVS